MHENRRIRYIIAILARLAVRICRMARCAGSASGRDDIRRIATDVKPEGMSILLIRRFHALSLAILVHKDGQLAEIFDGPDIRRICSALFKS